MRAGWSARCEASPAAVAALVDGAILVFATVCFAAEPRTYVGGLLRLVVPSKRARVDETLHEAAGTIALWLRARVISMVTVGVLVGVGLLLAVPFGWQRVLVVVALYWLAHALDDFIVIPITERRVVSLPPALTIAAQLVLGLAGGVLGIMMAAPFVAVATVLLRRLVVEDVVEANG